MGGGSFFFSPDWMIDDLDGDILCVVFRASSRWTRKRTTAKGGGMGEETRAKACTATGWDGLVEPYLHRQWNDDDDNCLLGGFFSGAWMCITTTTITTNMVIYTCLYCMYAGHGEKGRARGEDRTEGGGMPARDLHSIQAGGVSLSVVFLPPALSAAPLPALEGDDEPPQGARLVKARGRTPPGWGTGGVMCVCVSVIESNRFLWN